LPSVEPGCEFIHGFSNNSVVLEGLVKDEVILVKCFITSAIQGRGFTKGLEGLSVMASGLVFVMGSFVSFVACFPHLGKMGPDGGGDSQDPRGAI
jgi:hypothetical protein